MTTPVSSVFDVPCPYCGAKRGEACTRVRSRGEQTHPPVPHDDRVIAATGARSLSDALECVRVGRYLCPGACAEFPCARPCALTSGHAGEHACKVLA